MAFAARVVDLGFQFLGSIDRRLSIWRRGRSTDDLEDPNRPNHEPDRGRSQTMPPTLRGSSGGFGSLSTTTPIDSLTKNSNDPKVDSNARRVKRAGAPPRRRLSTRYTEVRDRLGPFELGETLGEGSFSKVKLGKHAVTGQTVAIKLVRLDQEENNQQVSKDFRREIEILKMVSSPNIVKLFEVFETDKYFVVVLEYCPGGDLFDIVTKRTSFNEALVKNQYRQIVQAVKELHDHNIAHRDLKLENILLDIDGNIKLADFGLAKVIPQQGSQLLETYCGSPDYAAPEVLRGKPYNGRLSDLWSLGVILYALTSGCFPFETRRDVFVARYFIPDNMPEDVVNLVEQLLRFRPESRLPLSQVLQHRWLQSPNQQQQQQSSAPIAKYPAIIAPVDF